MLRILGGSVGRPVLVAWAALVFMYSRKPRRRRAARELLYLMLAPQNFEASTTGNGQGQER